VETPQVMITDHGKPACVLKSVARPAKNKPSGRDYYARLLKRQPKKLPVKETRQFWEEERR
jgi:hypothetical protein